MNIFTIGASGLIGSRIVELLSDKHTFQDLSLTSGVDITDPISLNGIKNDTEHPVVLHLAAKADVDGCEADKPFGKDGAAYKINVLGTQNVVDACRAGSKKLLYISTDFVFDGENTPENGYTEEDTPNPQNWYAQTKFEGEEIVRNAGIPYVIIRIAYPYRKDFELKKDFVRAVAGRLAQNQPVIGITDHIFTPTFIDDIALAIGTLLEKDATGIYHVVGSQSLSPYEASLLIAKVMGYDASLVGKTTREAFFKGRAHRPFNLSMNNAKIKQLGVPMRSFEEGLKEMI
ncbi:MAG: SDR family oxidoreductase [Candidatus Levybacteria bacterium]|nr:SDR family oxidoreductase [Candidatus Levybacteria bacterium]